MSIPFDIPASLMMRYFAGELVRSGALLREAGSGRIVAHLQEAAGLGRLASMGGNPIGLAAQGVAQGVQIYQGEQIKAGLAFVQNLGIANLALTGVGIGVSLAGVALVMAKLGRIERGIGDLGAAIERLGRKVDGVRDHLIRQELADLRAELRRIDTAWTVQDADVQLQQWREAANRLLTIEERFHGHARAAIDTGHEPGLRDLMTDAYALAAEGRRSALLAADDDETADQAARDFHRVLVGLTQPLGAAELLHEMLAAEGVEGLRQRATATEHLRPQAEARAAMLREREDMAATAPLTIAALRQAGISGRIWLKHAREERTAPLICMTVADAARPMPV